MKTSLKIGKGNQIHESAIIGAKPLTLERNENGDYIRKEALQGVEIGNNCTIGPYTIVKSGLKNPTLIADHVHICEFVNIGHDCKIGRNTMIMPHVVLNGHVEIGEESIIYTGVLIRNRVKIGKNCIIGMGSLVVKDVPDHTFGYGTPFKPVKRNVSSRAKGLMRYVRRLGGPI